MGKIVNVDLNFFFNIGHFFIMDDEKLDVVVFQTAIMKGMAKQLLGGSDLKGFIGKNVIYSIDDDGILNSLARLS